jgi:hypothetical protein
MLNTNYTKPFFIISVDTEGDNLWERTKERTTKNARYIPRFQELCDKYSFKPTYLVNYEMCKDQLFADFAREQIRRQTAEIGMHLHAWDSPPLYNLTINDSLYHPYLTEYPAKIMQQKIIYLTSLLEDTFSMKMVSHRGGRWGFNEIYAGILNSLGYKVDCSVTPGLSWTSSKGDPERNGGNDYTDFPGESYYLNLNNIRLNGDSHLLEVPMSVSKIKRNTIDYMLKMTHNYRLLNKAIYHYFRPLIWFYPDDKHLKLLDKLVKLSLYESKEYIQMTIHSSELMPGGSPWLKSKNDIENLYSHLSDLFAYISEYFTGITLKEYYTWHKNKTSENEK